MLQDIFTGVVISASVIYMIRGIYRMVRSVNKASCTGCSGCSLREGNRLKKFPSLASTLKNWEFSDLPSGSWFLKGNNKSF
jgi:hypothetical protein